MGPGASTGTITLAFLMVSGSLTLIRRPGRPYIAPGIYVNASQNDQCNCEGEDSLMMLTLALPHKCPSPPELTVPNCSIEVQQPIRFIFLSVLDSPPTAPCPPAKSLK